MRTLLVTLAAVTLCAGAECTIRGKVLDPQARPVPFAIVTTELGHRVAADANGEYCLPTRASRITASARSTPPSASPSCRECCAPATDFVLTPTAVQGRSRIDIHLGRAPVYCVRGEIPAGTFLTLENADRTESASVITEGGRFLLTHLVPGTYTLTLTDQARLGRVLARTKVRIVDRNIEGLRLTRN